MPEPALVDRFQTSRAPIWEALYRLAQEGLIGLIERTPRKGTLVKGYARQEISKLYRVRITLEKMALERICEKPETIRACLAALDPSPPRDGEGGGRRSALPRPGFLVPQDHHH